LRFDPGPGFALRPYCCGLGLLVGFQRGDEGLQVEDTVALAIEPFGRFLYRTPDGLDLGCGLAPITLHPSKGFRRSSEAGIVRVEPPRQVGFGLLSRLGLGSGRAKCCVAALQFGGCVARSFHCLFQRSSRRTAAGRAQVRDRLEELLKTRGSSIQNDIVSVLYYRMRYGRLSPVLALIPGDWSTAVPRPYADAQAALARWNREAGR